MFLNLMLEQITEEEMGTCTQPHGTCLYRYIR